MTKTFQIMRYSLLMLLAVYWPSIALGTHLPQQEKWLDVPHDKLAHFGSYAGLAFLLTWCVMSRQPSARRSVAVLCVVVGYGLVDELTQKLVPTRHADVYDFLANCVGALTGLAIYYASVAAAQWLFPAEGRAGSPFALQPSPSQQRA